MIEGQSPVYVFGPFRLLARERRLERGGTSLRLGGRTLELLIVLLERAGEVVPARVLLENVWSSVTVDEGTLRFHVKSLRRTLGDNGVDTRYIVNVSGRGYCFAAPVARGDQAARARVAGGQPKLPVRATHIVGREDDIEIVSREATRKRLVTIAGPGGIGKTTLAIAAAQVLRTSFAEAVFFVDLAPITDPSLVVGAVVTALDQSRHTEDPVGGLIDYLQSQRLLLVLDNCEQVVETVAALVDRILREVTSTRLLVTSRETLRIEGEHVHRLMPLESPPAQDRLSAADALRYPAVQLFVERVTSSLGAFNLDDEQASVAGEICRRLDGIPLAIELAAARVELLGLSGLARGLNQVFTLLTEGRRFALPRHQTLRAALDWSYQLLTPVEQSVVQRLSTFRAMFDLDSALALVAEPATTPENGVAAIASLVAKSILTADRTGELVQYRLLEVTRLYAGEKLTDSGGLPAAMRRHAEHHLELVAVAPPNWESKAGKLWLRLYAGRIEDIRAALDWCLSESGDKPLGMYLLAASARLWFQLSLHQECRDRVEVALQILSAQKPVDPATEMHLQSALGHALWYSQGGAERVEQAFGRALTLADQLGDRTVRLQALWGMWASRRWRGHFRDALALARTYAAAADCLGDEAAKSLAARILALTHHHLGEQRAARSLSEGILDAARRLGDRLNSDFQLGPEIAAATILARALWLQGLPDQAAVRLREAFKAAEQSTNSFSMLYVVCFAGAPLALWTGDLAQAERYLGAVVNRAPADRWRRGWLSIVRLRQGAGRRNALIASYFEPRVDVGTVNAILARLSATTVAMPELDDDVGDALWSLPEVLRVNAELLLQQNGPDAAPAAEGRLLRSLELARQQAALSWELRTAMSLSRLWRRSGRAKEGRALLAATYEHFTEGFGTRDLVDARLLLASKS